MDFEDKDSCDYVMKILLVGESGVGKTCVIRRYLKNEFSLTHLSTIAIDFKLKKIQQGEDKIMLQLWDTAGQERFNTLTTAFFKGSEGIIIVFSITERRSFENVSKWISQIKINAPEDVCIILVGNKIDLKGQRQVSQAEGQDMAQRYGCEYIETSAKTGENIEQVFDRLSTQIMEVFKIKGQKKESDLQFKDGILVKSKKKCCKQ